MARKTFSDVKREVATNAPPARPDWMCAAWGCPLRGTMFSGSEGKCFIHESHSHMNLQALTREIAARDQLFSAMEAVLVNVDLVMWWTEIPGKYARPFRDLNRLDLLPTPEERRKTITAWARRVRNQLEVEVLAALGLNIATGKKPIDTEPRVYAPSDEDVAAAAAAEAAIASGTWRKVGAVAEAA